MDRAIIVCCTILVVATNFSSAYTSGANQKLMSSSDSPGLNGIDFSCTKKLSLVCYPYEEGELCQCPYNNFSGILKCNEYCNISAVLDCHCVMYNEEKERTEMGRCMYNCIYFIKHSGHKSNTYNIISSDPLNWTSETCGRYHRTGPLCGDCITDHYPQVYSLDVSCKPCSDSWSNWVKYLLVAYVPLTVFCFIILLFRINITASHLQGHVFFCQLVTIHMLACYMKLLNDNHLGSWSILGDVVLMFYGIWNLDFFRSFDLHLCVPLKGLTPVALDLAIAIYPLLLMILIYVVIHLYYIRVRLVVCIWRPFRSYFHTNWDMKASVIDAFATVFILCNIKFQSVCFYMLAPTKVYYFKNSEIVSYDWSVLSNSGMKYLSRDHLPFFILAVGVLLFLIAAPLLLVLLYPLQKCQHCLNLLSYRWQIILRSFVDTFQGCYKNGTECGTWDWRWFAVLPHVSQLVGFIILSVIPDSYLFVTAGSIVFILFSISIIVIEPHKPNLAFLSTSMAINTLFVACCSVSALGYIFYSREIFYIITVVFGLLPLFYFYCGLVLHFMHKKKLIMIGRF